VGRIAVRAFLTATLVFTLVSGVASAQTSAALAAEAKFSEGVRSMKAGQCEQALPSFRASLALDPASGTLLNIGYCEASLGKTASAWYAYRKALGLAEASQRQLHERIAHQEIDRLEPELPYLNVELELDSAPELRVELDGSVLEPAVWSIEAPVDPGAHSLRVFSRGVLKWENNFSVVARERRVLQVPASALSDALPKEVPTRAPVVARFRAAAAPPVAAENLTRVPSRPSAATAVALTSAGVGVVGLVAASVLFVGARHDYDEVESQCPANRCQNQASYDQRTAAVRRFHWSLGVGGGGIALLGVAAAVWFGTKPTPEPSAQHIAIQVDSTELGVSWQRAF
jgi:hypothetical protein